MKTKQILFALVVFIIYTLTACKKDSITEQSAPSTVSADSNFISKVIRIQKRGTQIDSINTTYNYDNLKRVSLISSTFNSASYSALYLNTYYYNGTDTIPFKMVETSSTNYANVINYDTTLSFYSYSNSKQLIKDSTLIYRKNNSFNSYDIYKSITTYSYSLNKIYSFNTYSTLYSLSPTSLSSYFTEFDTATLDVNKNIIGTKIKYVSYSTPPPPFPPSTSISFGEYIFTYGNNPSPFLRQNINLIFPSFERESDFSLYRQIGNVNNNLKTKSISFNQTGTPIGFTEDDFTGKYIFKTNGFPSSILFQSSFNLTSPLDYSKFTYFYTSL